MVLFSTAVIIAWHGLFQSYRSSSDPSYVFAVQIGFSTLLCSSAILTLESISPSSILSNWWQQHGTQSHVVLLFSFFIIIIIISISFALHLRNIFHLEIFFYYYLFVFCLKIGDLWALLTLLVPICWHHVFVEFKIIIMLIKLFSDSSVILSSCCHWDIRLEKLFFFLMITDLKYWDLEICCK